MMNKRLMKVADWIMTAFIWAFFIVVFLICVRIFAFDTYRIPSHSMTPTIVSGDNVLLNKLPLGARIYKNFDFLDGGRLETWRIAGFRKIRHNDIVAFNYPYEKRNISFDISVVHLKRCVGIPGDTLSIKNGYIYASSFAGESLGYRDKQQELSLADSTRYAPGVFRALPRGVPSANNWTIRNLGPLLVPGRGITVSIDSTNYRLYGAIIEYESGGKLRFEEGCPTLDDKGIDHYTFLQNYYFMVGDNAINSRDSRYWGFVPEEYVTGVVSRVLWSQDRETKKIDWKRLFKKLE